MVYHCSASHWIMAALTWPHGQCRESIAQIRSLFAKSVALFGIGSVDFDQPETSLAAQDAVDILQLKGSLMESATNLQNQVQTPQVAQMLHLIDTRIRSIGPISGLADGPNLSFIPPFLRADLNLELSHSDFTLGDVIGTGTFGKVCTATMNGTMKKVAVKVLRTPQLGGRQLETFRREVWTMATVKHPALLRLIGVTLTHPFCIVTELLKRNLYDQLRFLTPTKRSIIACSVAQGMQELHASRIIHRDLKSANILLDEDDLPRVCDFGLVGFVKKGTKTGFVGTAQWMAPELLRSSPFYDEKVDVYSFAVLLWELLTLQRPYEGLTQDQLVLGVIDRGMRPLIPSHFGPPGLVALIYECWAENPNDRPSFERIVSVLRRPDAHFIGTNNDEFDALIPKVEPHNEIINAFDSQNWQRFAELLDSQDPSVIDSVISLFRGLNDNHRSLVIRMLPRMVNFEDFLSLKGYFFVVSLFQCSEEVVVEIVNLLRTVDVTSMAFRQQKLIHCLSTCPNAGALQLLADLCKCKDIATHIAKHHLPFVVEGFRAELLLIYCNIVVYPEVRQRIADHEQPLRLAKDVVGENPNLACLLLSQFPFGEGHVKLIVQLGLLTEVFRVVSVEPRAIVALRQLFLVLPLNVLVAYSHDIFQLLDYNSELSQDAVLLKKLEPIRAEHVPGPRVEVTRHDSLIDF
jgi:serine/threonine protein kinase